MRHHAFRYACPVLLVLTTALIIAGFACSDKSTGPPEIFAPEIASISPERGPVGTRVAIKGEHFGNEIGSILFGDRAPNVALWSDTLIQADAPQEVHEPCYIYISTGEDKMDSIWFVVEYLRIESISPYHGLPGTEVTITGQNFGSSQGTVFFDSLTAEIISWSDTQIMAIVPDNSISCHVEVRSGNMVSNIRVFAIDKMTITQIIPNRAIPNTQVEIRGYKFGGHAGTVQFQDANGEVVSWSDTLIAAKVPLGASSGNVRVGVGGAKSNAISFNAEELYITHLIPESATYNTEIEIHGTFYGATSISVIFGDVEIEAEDFNDTLIVMTIPTGVNSGDVRIKANDLTSNSIYFEVLHMTITSVEPDSAIVGQKVVIHGQYFGATQGLAYIDGLEAPIESWTDSLIEIRIPENATAGELLLTNDFESSNIMTMNIITNPTLLQRMMLTNYANVSFYGYNTYVHTKYMWGPIEICDTITKAGRHYADNDSEEWPLNWDNDSCYLTYRVVITNEYFIGETSINFTIKAWFSQEGEAIDSLAFGYASRVTYSMFDFTANSGSIIAKNIQIDSVSSIPMAVFYQISGAEIQSHILKLSFWSGYSSGMDNNVQEYTSYLDTDWDNAEYSPYISVVFMQK